MFLNWLNSVKFSEINLWILLLVGIMMSAILALTELVLLLQFFKDHINEGFFLH